MKVLVTQSRSILSNPVDCSLTGSSDRGILQARILSGLPCPPPGDLPDPGIELAFPALVEDSSPPEPPGVSFCPPHGPGNPNLVCYFPEVGELPGPKQTASPRDMLCEVGWFGFGILESPSEPVLGCHPEDGWVRTHIGLPSATGASSPAHGSVSDGG